MVTATSNKNYRCSINTQIIICVQRCRVPVDGQCRPGDRNDGMVARHIVAHRLNSRVVSGDGGYRGIPAITTPRRDKNGRIIRNDHHRVHRRIRGRVEHVIAWLEDWQILRQSRRRGEAINHSLHIIAEL